MDILDDIKNDIKFTKRAVPIPLGARMSYRIAQICLILYLSCKPRESCSIEKLQTISNALFQPQQFQALINYIRNPNIIINFTPRIDPCVNSAIEFSIKYGLCKAVAKRKYKLTTIGRKYVAAILMDDIMLNEKTMLHELGQNFTEDIIDRI